MHQIRTRFFNQLIIPALILMLALGAGSASAAPIIEAEKIDTLNGDTIRYTVVVRNTGDSDALNVALADTVDPHTTLADLLGSDFRSTPIGRDDVYDALGNVAIVVPNASGLLGNDSDPDGTGPVTIVAYDATSANGGSVSAVDTAGGGFTYHPPAGFQGTDTFSYTIEDLDGNRDSATVTVTVDEMIWFVDNAQAAQGDGRLTSPFNSLDGPAGYNAAAADAPGDIVFVYAGSGNYHGGITLQNDQYLIGDGVDLASAVPLTLPSHSLPLPAGPNARPTLANSAGNGVTLAAGNTVRGLNIGPTSGVAVVGSSVGSLTVNTLAISGAAGGLDIDTGNLAVTVDSIASSGGAYGVRLLNTSGSLTVSGLATLDNATNEGLRIVDSTAAISFGPVNITNRNATGIWVDNADGTSLTLGDVDIPNPKNIPGGYGLRIQNSAANVTIASADISNVIRTVHETIGPDRQRPTSDGNGDAIFLMNNSGSFALNGGTIQDMGDNGLDLRTVRDIALSGVTIARTADSGIQGVDVVHFSFTNGSVTDFGDDLSHVSPAVNDSGLWFRELTGNAVIQNSTIGPDASFAYTPFPPGIENDGIEIWNQGTAALNLSVTGSTFTQLSNDGLDVRSQASGTATVMVDGAAGANSFDRINGRATSLDHAADHASNGDLLLWLTSNSFDQVGIASRLSAAGGSGSGSQHVVTNNTMTSVTNDAVRTIVDPQSTSLAVEVDARIADNTFGGGSAYITARRGGVLRIAVQDNSGISGAGGLTVEASRQANLDATIHNNTVAVTTLAPPWAFAAIYLQAANPTLNAANLCVGLNGNSFATEAGGLDPVAFDRTGSSVIQLAGFAGTTDPAAATYVAANNALIGGFSSPPVSFYGIPPNVSAGPAACDQPQGLARTPGAAAAVEQARVTVAASDRPDRPAIAPPAQPASASTASFAQPAGIRSGETFTASLGTLNAGQVVTITFEVTVDTPLPAGVEQVCNQSTVTGDNFAPVSSDDPDTGTAGDPTCTPVDAAPDLQVTKNDGGITAQPGDTISYTLVYTNAGDQNAAGVVLTETVPANSSFSPAASSAGWVCAPDNSAGSSCTLAIGVLAGNGGGGSAVFAVTVASPVPAGVEQISNTVAIGDDGTSGADANPADNSAGDSTPLAAAPDLQLDKDDDDFEFLPGDTITYTLTYTNAGDQGATGVALTETVPADTSFNPAASSAGWVCTPDNSAGSSCTLAIGALAGGGAGGSAVFAITVDNPAPGVTLIRNTATIGDDGANGADGNPADNSASQDTPISNQPPSISDLSITSPIDENSTATLSGTISDPDASDAFTLTVDWGDGSTPEVFGYPAGTTAFTETHPYLDDNPTGTPADVHLVTLSLTDGINVVPDATSVTVNNVAPALSDVTITPTLNENGTATLSGNITDPGTLDTLVLTVHWGDGSPPQTINYPAGTAAFSETHQYLDDDPSGTPADPYVVTLILTDDDTGEDGDTTSTTVSNVAPTLSNLAATSPIDENGISTLTGAISDPGTLDTFTLQVDWGDGITETFSYPAGTAIFSETHRYLDDALLRRPLGDFLIQLALSDDDMGTDSGSVIVTVNNVAPEVEAGPNQAGDEGDTFGFTGIFTETSPADTHTIEWAFGDGAVTTGTLTPSHTYADNGSYTVLLTVTDDNGGVGQDSLTVTVDNVAPAVEAGLDQAGNEGDTFLLTGVYTDPGTLDTHLFEWNLGDGTIVTSTTSAATSHIYTNEGVYTATLTVTDKDGGVGADSLQVTVSNVAPVAVDDSYLTPEDTPLLVAAPGVLGNDIDPGDDTLTAVLDSGPVTGTLALSPDGSFAFTPTLDYNGVVTFTYHTFDGLANSSTAVVTITVQAVNDPPDVVNPGDQATNEGETVSLFIQASDVENDPLTYSAQGLPTDLSINPTSGEIGGRLGYSAQGFYTVTVGVSDGALTSTVTFNWTITNVILYTYLPLVSSNDAFAPDLVVEDLVVTGDNVQVIIANRGPAATAESFWVDVYLSPDAAPTAVNQTWEMLGDEGLVWGVTVPLAPGEVLTLTIGDTYYRADQSHWSGSIPAGTPVYAQVDSANANTTYGAVRETHEITGRPYNNLAGPAYPAGRGAQAVPPPAGSAKQDLGHLPPRP